MADKRVEYSCNAEDVLKRLTLRINAIEAKKKKMGYSYRGFGKVLTRDVCEELSIFDWWVDDLTLSNMKDMQAFLKIAIKMGYTGYVCFKVGASMCANGMWAHKLPRREDGYAPDGEFLYRSFTPDYIEWDACLPDGTMVMDHIPKEERKGAKNCVTLAQVKGCLIKTQAKRK